MAEFEDITPKHFDQRACFRIFRHEDGRWAVRGELVHSMRVGDQRVEGMVVIDPALIKEAIVLWEIGEALKKDHWEKCKL